MAKPRPIVVLDTSVFLKDAMSPTHKGAASQILAILPAIATIVLCDEIRQEILEKFSEILGWTEKQVMATYSPVFESGDLGHPGPRAGRSIGLTLTRTSASPRSWACLRTRCTTRWVSTPRHGAPRNTWPSPTDAAEQSRLAAKAAPSAGCRPSGSQQCRRHDRNPIPAAVGFRPGGDDDGVKQIIAQALAEPQQMAHVFIGYRASQLHFDRHLRGPSIAIAATSSINSSSSSSTTRRRLSDTRL